VTAVFDSDGALVSFFHVGDEFELRFAVNNDAQDSDPNPAFGIYNQALVQADAVFIRDGNRYYEARQADSMPGLVEVWDEPIEPGFIECCTDELLYKPANVEGEDVGLWELQQFTWGLSAWNEPRPLLSDALPRVISPAQFDSTIWSLRFMREGDFSSFEVIGEISSIESVEPTSGYDSWADANIPSGKDASFNGDWNEDGTPNGVEYVFGNVGITPNGRGSVPAPPSIPADVDVYLERSSTLTASSWNPVASWIGGASVVLAEGLTIEGDEVRDESPAERLFYRYRVVLR